MQDIKNFIPYTPSSADAQELISGLGAVFLKSEDGQDWYECQSKFEQSSIKILYDEKGIIRSITTDVSTLNPAGMSVAEVENLPQGCDLSGQWQYKDGLVQKYQYTQEELIALADDEKKARLKTAADAIAPLQDAADLGIATDDELALLAEWKRYRVLLNRVDTSTAPDIDWPEPPVSD